MKEAENKAEGEEVKVRGREGGGGGRLTGAEVADKLLLGAQV